MRPGSVVLVCGSRDWAIPERIIHRLGQLPPGTLVLHGGASRVLPDTGEETSADMLAETICRSLGIETRIYRPDYRRYGRAAPLRRNDVMLDYPPGLVVAFQRGRSRGTQYVIDGAYERGIPTEVHRP